MKAALEKTLSETILKLEPSTILPKVTISRTKDNSHGDFASNIAMQLAKLWHQAPHIIAQKIIANLPQTDFIKDVKIAGPGFINFFVIQSAHNSVIKQILEQKNRFGVNLLGANKKVILEFVSANPTGPLHVGHGRGAAFGASLANILRVSGFDVSCEYYVNDAGRQMNILALSVWLRYLELHKQAIDFPPKAYCGEYVKKIADNLCKKFAAKFVFQWQELAADSEAAMDNLIAKAQEILGDADDFAVVHKFALNSVLDDIKDDLGEFGVHFDNYFSERQLLDDGSIQKGIAALKDAGFTYINEGALWFRSTAFGDEKDRVLVRANKQSTYFASDVAYHWNKYKRGFNIVMDIFGADHHGYVTRVRAAVEALGHNKDALDIFLVQFAILYRGGARVQMSTRSGSFVTLRDLRGEVGNDAARFLYVSRKSEQHMDFDLDVAKAESSDNPVYYIQYAHARICSVIEQMKIRNLTFDKQLGLDNVAMLSTPIELELVNNLAQYPEVVMQAAKKRQPHLIAYYLRKLATNLHSYYNAIVLLVADNKLRFARMCLLEAIAWVIKNALALLGVSSPESM